MYRHEPLEKYLNDAAAGTPTPGGGSVAALVGALATTLSSMSANLTRGNDNFKRYDAQLKKILAECEKTRETLLSLVEEDIAAYRKLYNAYSLPKSSESEKIFRSEAIQQAGVIATEIPLKTTLCCLYILELTRELVDIANPKLIADVGVAGFLAEAAFQSAKLNVESNLTLLKNQRLVEKMLSELNHAEQQAKTFFQEIQEKVRKTIKG